MQAPISRFGDTASSAGTLILLESNPFTKKMLEPAKMMFASIGVVLFRLILTPIDNVTDIGEGRDGDSYKPCMCFEMSLD